jgi:hypothetical protein
LKTPDEYKNAILACIRKKQVEVHDIFVVPDYSKILHACSDEKFGNYAKGISTQHQFIFEAVEVHSFNFPKGVKVSYRAYSQDEVHEIIVGPNGATNDNENVIAQICTVSTFPEERKVKVSSGSKEDTVTVPAGICICTVLQSNLLTLMRLFRDVFTATTPRH